MHLKTINQALKDKGYKDELVKGRSYYYFTGETACNFYSGSVNVNKLSQLTLEQWVAEYESKLCAYKAKKKQEEIKAIQAAMPIPIVFCEDEEKGRDVIRVFYAAMEWYNNGKHSRNLDERIFYLGDTCDTREKVMEMIEIEQNEPCAFYMINATNGELERFYKGTVIFLENDDCEIENIEYKKKECFECGKDIVKPELPMNEAERHNYCVK
jgi:hypothetical protein